MIYYKNEYLWRTHRKVYHSKATSNTGQGLIARKEKDNTSGTRFTVKLGCPSSGRSEVITETATG
jgi:hypothetical protein